jgi:hypothetical protein
VSGTRHSCREALPEFAKRRHAFIALFALAGIALYLVLRFAGPTAEARTQWPLWAVLLIGGVPLTIELLLKVLRRRFGSDLLAGIAIVAAVLLEE